MLTHAQKRRLTLWIMVAVLTVLLTVIALQQWQSQPEPSTLQAQSIQHIRLQHAEKPNITLQRNAGGWRIIEPISVQANSLRVEPLLSLSASARSGYAPEDVDLDAAGLTTSTSSITLDNTHIILGESAVQGDKLYAMINQQVVFVPSWVQPLIQGGISVFADLTVFANTNITDPQAHLYLMNGGQHIAIAEEQQLLWKNLTASRLIMLPKTQIETQAQIPLQTPSKLLRSDLQQAAMQLSVHIGTKADTPTTQHAPAIAQLYFLDKQTYLQTEPNFVYVIPQSALAELGFANSQP